MNIVEPFIQRPVATTLLTAGIALAGIVSFGLLPVSPLPQVDFPTVSVSASLPGASPEVMAATVAQPLERALGRIAGVTEMTSNSSLGSTRVTLQFELSRNIDAAAREVQAAIQAARTELPSSLPNNPTYRKVNPADAPVMILAMTSDVYTRGQMYDIASTVLAQRISQVPGVGQVTVGGGSLPAVRVDLNPTVLNKLGITFEEVRAAIQANNVNRPKGFLEDGERYWQILANDQAKSAREYMPIVVAYRNGAAVRLQDLGEVSDSVQDVRNFGVSNGKPAVMLIINRQPNANIIEVVDRVTALLPQFRASIPAAVSLEVMMERTTTIRASLREVERALAISVALVILVVFLFLRSARATLIPAIAVPVSLIGTFSAMHLLGYSLNNLSLMALTIATGFVVDDAIVVLENVQRYIEKGLSPAEAALKGAREVAFTVVSISVSLVAVFIPILFMGGIVGRLFREFAVTLSVAIAISLAVSLTTTPMMCAVLLRAKGEGRPPGRLSRWAEGAFERLRRGYGKSLALVLRYPLPVLLVFIATIGVNAWLYTVVPKGFFPQQDTGRLIGFVRADQSSSFESMREKLQNVVEIVARDPAVEGVTAFTGGGRSNRGTIFVTLKPLAAGREPLDTVLARLRPAVAREPGASAFLNPIQDLRGGGRQADASTQFTLRGEDISELRTWAQRLEQELRQAPELTDVNSDQESRGLQATLVIDRATAARLGVSIRAIDSTLGLAFGQSVASTIYQDRNQYRVIMGAGPAWTRSPATLEQIHVLSNARGLVPLSQLARFETTLAPLSVSHQGGFAATTISFNLAEGVAMSEATEIVGLALARIGAPTNIYASFEGTARLFQRGLENQPWLILAAVLTVYIVLGILYESTLHPITILSTLPSAGVGALIALLLFRTEFSIIALIGVFLLIGIVKKNAIMMVDFALAARRSTRRACCASGRS